MFQKLKPEEIQQARQAETAATEGKTCGMCGAELSPEAAIWRRSFWVGRWNIRRSAAICRQCHEQRDGDGSYHRYYPARRCGGCGRPVH
jgi:hypothetical protein